MGENELEILITAVDEASAAFESVGEAMGEMSAEAQAASSETEAALNEVGLTMNSVTGEITDALLTQEQSFAAAAALMQENGEEIMQVMMDTGASAQEAASIIEEANAEIASSSSETADEVAASSGSSKGSLMAIGVAAGIAFGLVESAVSSAISSATQWDETSAIIGQKLQDIGSSTPVSAMQAYAQQIQNVTLFSQQQALAAESVIAGSKQLEPQYQSLTMLSADVATSAQQFGGSATDMGSAMKIITQALADPVAGLTQLQKQAGIEIPAATVTMIKNLANAGDTAAADTVLLKALNGQVGGLAQAAAGAPGAALAELSNHLSALGTTIGNELLPMLDKMANFLEPIVADITAWVTEHPKLTEALVIGVVVFTALLAVLALVAVVVAAVGAAFAGMAVAISAGVAVIAALVITNFTTIKDVLETTWDAQLSRWSDLWTDMLTFLNNAHQFLLNGINSLVNDVMSVWNAGLTGMETLAENVWNAISNTFKSGVNYVISAINGLINALDSIHISIPAIQIPGTKIGTPALDLGFNIPDIPMLAAGGIVYNPVLAMIGEQGPEAVVPLSSLGGGGGLGGGQPIQIFIQGGNYLDQNGATMIGNALAQQIIRQIRVSNYRS